MKIIEPENSMVEALANENVQLQCKHTHSKPEAIVSWLYNGNLIGESESDKYYTEQHVLIVKHVISNDSGNYTCVLSNGYHPVQQLNYYLLVSGNKV